MATLGYPVHDTGWDTHGFNNGTLVVSKFTQASAVTMTELHGWVFSNGGPAGSCRLVVYADSAGLPGARVAYTGALATAATGDLEVSETGLSVSLAAGDYWLGVYCITNSGGGAGMYGGAGGTHKGIASGASNPPPSTFGTPNQSGTKKLTVWAVVGTPVSAPVADFSGTPTSGALPLSVAFTDTSTNTPTSWAWTFGDGGTSTSQNPSHSYAAAGTYTVTLVATNAGGSDTETKTGYVTVAYPTGTFTTIKFGANLAVSDEGSGVIRVDSSSSVAHLDDIGDVSAPTPADENMLYWDAGGGNWASRPALLPTIADAKGDLVAASGADAVARLAVGTNGQVLTADSTQTLGVKWAAAAGAGAVVGSLVAKLRTGATANRYYAAGEVAAQSLTSGASTANHIRVLPFISSQAITADRIGIANTNGVSGNMRLGIYADDGNLYPSTLLLDSGNISTNATGMLEATISQALSAGTVYWLAYLPSAAPSPRGLSVVQMMPILGHDPASAAFGACGWDLTVTYGALPNPFTAGAAVINASPVEAIFLRAA